MKRLVTLLLLGAAFSLPAQVMISQVYGGGGNAGATLKNDFIEIFNRSASTVSLAGWSVQYAAAAGSNWQVTALSGTLGPGQYYLVQESAGAGGTVNLPPPDATGNIAMSATSGKVADFPEVLRGNAARPERISDHDMPVAYFQLPFPSSPQPLPAVTSVSAASFAPGGALAPGAIASAFGSGWATATGSAATVPLPTTLAGTSVRIRDSAGAEFPAPLFFTSAGQVNYLVPEGIRPGTATVTVASNDRNVAQGNVQIETVAPGLFTANADGRGVTAALAQRAGDGGTLPVFQCGSAPGSCVPVALDLGEATDQVILILFGTGIRGRSGPEGVAVRIGGATADVLYAGPQGSFAGLDQVNVRLPRSLIGRGEVDLALIVDGRMANLVRVSVR